MRKVPDRKMEKRSQRRKRPLQHVSPLPITLVSVILIILTFLFFFRCGYFFSWALKRMHIREQSRKISLASWKWPLSRACISLSLTNSRYLMTCRYGSRYMSLWFIKPGNRRKSRIVETQVSMPLFGTS